MSGRDLKYSGYNIPTPLEVALQRFGEWLDAQLKREQDNVTPKKQLYHYTGWDGLEGILRNRHLRFFGHDQQDDKEEFEYSLALALSEIDRVSKQLCKNCARVAVRAYPGVVDTREHGGAFALTLPS